MKIIILGAGQVGGSLAEHLASEANDITVVDAQNLQVIKKIPSGELPWGVVVGQAP